MGQLGWHGGRIQCCSSVCAWGSRVAWEPGGWGGEVLGLSSAPRSTVLAEEEREVPKARQQCDTFPASLSSTSLDIPPTHIEI